MDDDPFVVFAAWWREQNVPMVFAITDQCVIIEKGRIVAQGTRDEVSKSDVMREYLAI